MESLNVGSQAIRVEITDDPGAFEDLGPWWNSQVGPAGSPFMRTEWFETWVTTRLHSDDRLHLLLARDGNDPVAALPLVKRGMKVRAISDGASDVFDLVHSGGCGTADLLDRLGRETHVTLDRVDWTSPLVEAVEDQPGWTVQRRLESPYVDLSGGPEHVSGQLGKNLKKNTRRGLRRLQSLGELSIDTSLPLDVDGLLDEAYELEAAGWKGSRGTAVANDKGKMDFFRSFARLAAERGWLRFAVARLDGRMVAFNYDVEYANRMYGILTSYDETLDPRCSLGSVLFRETLEDAMSRGVESYEMGGDHTNEWKMMWTSTTRPRVDIVGFGSHLTGKMAQSAVKAKRRIGALVRGQRPGS